MEAETRSVASGARGKVRLYGHWIDGAESGEPVIERISPADGSVLAAYADGGAAEVDRAVNAARRVFESSWSKRSAVERASALQAWADLIAADIPRLAIIEAEEVGKPIRYARGEVEFAIQLIRYAASLAVQIKGDVFDNLGPGALGMVTRAPRGVVGMIVPWNFPIITLAQKLPFALAVGCTAVVKPSELTSGTALEIARLAGLAGIPAGAINIVTGYGKTVGAAIAAHPGVNMLSFTGSSAVGRQIAQAGAERFVPVALELGGKGANIVFGDADLNQALDGVLFGAMLNQGQECCAGARLLIEETVADSFLEELTARASRIRVGDPLSEDTDLGPLIHQQHLERVLGFVDGARREGGRILSGGTRMTSGDLGRGNFMGVTIVDRVDPQMEIFRKEVFGPVLTVTRFRDDAEALTLANDTEYGLASGLWTSRLDRAHAVAAQLQTGSVYVNTYLESAMQLPFGGWKQSGLGRELGMEGLLEFTEIKSTFFKLGGRALTLPHTA